MMGHMSSQGKFPCIDFLYLSEAVSFKGSRLEVSVHLNML